jgi:hypothetical protein
MLKLAEAIKAKGDTVEPTAYFTGEFTPRETPALPGERDYLVTRTYFRTGTSSKGKPFKTPAKDSVKLNVKDVRKLAKCEGVRGRVSESAIKDALRALRATGGSTVAWSDEDIENASVTRVAVKSADKSAKPSKPKAKGKETSNAKDLVSVDASGSSAPSETE